MSDNLSIILLIGVAAGVAGAILNIDTTYKWRVLGFGLWSASNIALAFWAYYLPNDLLLFMFLFYSIISTYAFVVHHRHILDISVEK